MNIFGQRQVGQPLVLARDAEQPNDCFFTVQCRERTNPHLNARKTVSNATFLGNVGPIGKQLSEHFQAGHDVRSDASWKCLHGLEHSVDAPADFQPVRRRLQMKIARFRLTGSGKQPVDQTNDRFGVDRFELGKFATKLLYGKTMHFDHVRTRDPEKDVREAQRLVDSAAHFSIPAPLR